MMHRRMLLLFGLLLGGVMMRAQVKAGGQAEMKPGRQAETKIDREALVSRHNVKVGKADPLAALSVGNGHFAFTVDATGLQSFPEYYEKGVPLGTEADWGWHSFVDTGHYRPEEALKEYDIHGRKETYSVQWHSPERNRQASEWFRQNVHRLQLGNIGFELDKKDGTLAVAGDIKDIHQELDLWKGEIKSVFTLEGVRVYVSTMVHPGEDVVSVSVRSDLISQGRLHIRLRFPYPTGEFGDDGDDWANADRHLSGMSENDETGMLVTHRLDTTQYFVHMKWEGKAEVRKKEPHYFLITPRSGNIFSISCRFSSADPLEAVPSYAMTGEACSTSWSRFWRSGGAVDLSGSKDPRAFELERRIVLSQYLTRIQNAGDDPPQETGLTYNSWYGKPHMEMFWWHCAHFALWGRSELLERSLDWYRRAAPIARQIAERQGYKGVRWQKMTDPAGRESPSSIGAFLIWQQPHFIYFTELCYRLQKTAEARKALLEKYKDLVFATADFMASYAWYDDATHRYILGKGLIPAQERFKEDETFNPCFELAYWRWILSVAQQWRARLGLPADAGWQKVEDGLSDLPRQDSLYYPAESATDAYTNLRYRGDHPVVLATFGFLPATKGLDTVTMRRTFDWVWKNWSWAETWGWDFPLTAMCATRLGKPDKAIDALLMPVQKNTYLVSGHNYQDDRLRLYLPGNGGLLAAVALMCAGYDGCPRINPGFPKDGKWKVRWEGLSRMP